MSTDLPREPRIESGPSVGTIVWGVIVVALAGIIAGTRFNWFTIDPQVAAITLLVLAGLALIAGGSLAALRGRRADDDGNRT